MTSTRSAAQRTSRRRTINSPPGALILRATDENPHSAVAYTARGRRRFSGVYSVRATSRPVFRPFQEARDGEVNEVFLVLCRSQQARNYISQGGALVFWSPTSDVELLNFRPGRIENSARTSEIIGIV